ncbi:hypothetical protein [Sporosarcina limicola]|uniref:Uncharacterized protein n=1 Tax=Sporosarcina limicola TaxID=34101 RepID=A0A927MHA3_9BACL|nr:hypothetical protein [Sporosarcina limicola]MBE1554603.1 hypothetical protein [Sporosarcina limicola]
MDSDSESEGFAVLLCGLIASLRDWSLDSEISRFGGGIGRLIRRSVASAAELVA